MMEGVKDVYLNSVKSNYGDFFEIPSYCSSVFDKVYVIQTSCFVVNRNH